MKTMKGWKGLVLVAVLGTAFALAGAGCPRKASLAIGPDPTAGVVPLKVTCGDSDSCTIWAGQTIDAGSVTVSNDAYNVYVTFEANPNFSFNTMHLWVGCDLADAPKNSQGTPVPGQFPYHSANVTAVTSYTFTVQMSTLCAGGISCGDPLVILAHAEVNAPDGSETGWGGCLPGTGTNRWYFYMEYVSQCCDNPPPGDFRTQTQGGWGTTCHGDNPGCYRDDNFAAAFPNGLVVGCDGGRTLTLTTSAAVEAFLPQGGAPRRLNSNEVNPTSSSAGVLAGQLVALALNLAFDGNPDFGTGTLADQVVCNTDSACDGMTVQQVFDEGNKIIGGCASALSAGDIASCLALVNENYTDGTVDLGYLCAP